MRFTFFWLISLFISLNSFTSALNERPIEEETLYFVLTDRFYNSDSSNDKGGLSGNRLEHGYDPFDKGFFHGGDLKGLEAKLDYIKDLGATAIWLAPIFTNKVVQGPKGMESSGYHGYWITDFYNVDPHFGTNAEFKSFVKAAHAKGLKVIMDIVINHTADVIKIRECGDYTVEEYKYCNYQYFADAPNGSRERYTPFILPGEPTKNPKELNDLSLYNNRGDSNWFGEGAIYGDFSGLDDLDTTNPKVMEVMLDIYKYWIEEFDVDGYRIDTARHVNDEFWAPFLTEIYDHATKLGKNNFYIFGEASYLTPDSLAAYQRRSGYTHLLDFPFSRAAIEYFLGNMTADAFQEIFTVDSIYLGGQAVVNQFPIYISNHDHGRLGYYLQDSDQFTKEEVLAKLVIANALMFTVRGVPTIYYGDEQGFTGDGGDKDAREDMFPSKVSIYNDNILAGGGTTEEDNFNSEHPLFKYIKYLSNIRSSSKALKYGKQETLFASNVDGLFAYSRYLEDEEVLVVINNSNKAWKGNLSYRNKLSKITNLYGECAQNIDAESRLLKDIVVQPLSFAICSLN